MRIVLVEWVDASSYSGWHKFDPSMDSISRCVSVGILKHEDKEQVILLTAFSDSGNVSDTHAIPKCSIKRMRTLKIQTKRDIPIKYLTPKEKDEFWREHAEAKEKLLERKSFWLGELP